VLYELGSTSTSQTVNDALELIETDLQEAVVTAIERIDAVLASKPEDTRALRLRASFFHQIAAQIDKNRERRPSSPLNF
jgi:hypothetical protein